MGMGMGRGLEIVMCVYGLGSGMGMESEEKKGEREWGKTKGERGGGKVVRERGGRGRGRGVVWSLATELCIDLSGTRRLVYMRRFGLVRCGSVGIHG